MEDPCRDMEVFSTCIKSILGDLELLEKNLREDYSYMLNREKSVAFSTLKMNLPCLGTFLWCTRKLSNNDMYSDLESKGVNLRSLASTIEENLKKFEEDIHSLCLRPQSEYMLSFKDLIVQHSVDGSENKYISPWEPVVCGFREKIESFKDGIKVVYQTLAGRSSSRGYCSLKDDELVELVDCVLQNLAGLRRPLLLRIRLYDCLSFATSTTVYDNKMALHSQIEVLQDELTFSKNLIRFARLRDIEDGLLKNLLIHLEFPGLLAALLAYGCSFHEDCEWQLPALGSCIGFLLEVIKFRLPNLSLLQIEALESSKSSALLPTTEMTKHIMVDFNDSLISRLWPLLWSSTSLMDCLKDQMLILYEGLRFLRSILREAQENLLDELNGSVVDVIICAVYMLFGLELQQITCPRFLSHAVGIFNKGIQHIKDQSSRLSTIECLASEHCFTGKKGGTSSGTSSSTLMASKGYILKSHEVVVGFDDEERKVINRLTNGSKDLEIVPIVGMPGLGKTTLAKKVYDDISIESHFHIRIWCTVSQSYNKKNLLLQLLGDGGKYNETLQTWDEYDLLDTLYKKLKGNRYLVVFDDVWDMRVFQNDLKIAFQNDGNGSKILVTSRFSNVAANVEPHSLRLLTDEESWQLLQKKVFGEEDCPQSLLGPGMEIAKFCKGLPLTVVVIAGVLTTIEHDNWTWEDFAKSLTSTMMSGTDSCKKSLELSYEHLPYHLKACLLYFAAFREDQYVATKNLMWLWIAEGFVEKTDGKNLEDIAEEYMMDLIYRNLVMVSKRRSIDGRVKACHIHDLLFEFCKAKAKEENFLQALRGYDELSIFNEPPNLPRLSICSSGEDFKKSRLFCPHLKSMLFFLHTAGDEFPLLDSSFIFCIYKHLMVLNLEHILLTQTEFPSGVESLLDLRYLALRANVMQFIPQSIAKLSNLETFRLKIYWGCVTLPDTIWNMKKLRHLHGSVWVVTPHLLPNDNGHENSSTLPDLDTISALQLPLGQEGENIMREIPNVRQVEICLSDKEIRGGSEAAKDTCNMSRLERLESLKVSADLQFNIEISFPSTLKKLSLGSLKLPWSKISLIEQLPNLEVLKLHHAFSGKRWEMIEGGFPKLRILTLSGVDVVEWTETETETDSDSDDYLTCLQQLNLYGNLKLKQIPSCLERLLTLEMIKVRFRENNKDDCNFSIDNYSVVSLVRAIEKEQKSYGNENLKILIDRDYSCMPS